MPRKNRLEMNIIQNALLRKFFGAENLHFHKEVLEEVAMLYVISKPVPLFLRILYHFQFPQKYHVFERLLPTL